MMKGWALASYLGLPVSFLFRVNQALPHSGDGEDHNHEDDKMHYISG